MRRRPWLRRTVWGAFLLSMFLHVTGIGGRDIYRWLTRPEFTQTDLRKSTRELKAQLLEDEATLARGGVKQPGSLDVFLRKPSQPHPVSLPSRMTEKKAERRTAEVAASQPGLAAGAGETLGGAGKMLGAVASAPIEKKSRASQVANLPVAGLERYPRELKMTYIWEFFPVPVHMTWNVAQGHYNLRLEGGFAGVSRTFVSSGKVGQHGVIPERFAEYRNENAAPFYQADFDWQKMVAEVGESGNRKSEKLAVGDQDIFSTAFHVGLIGGRNSEHHFSMFSGRRKYEDVHLKVAGEAKLRLGKQEVDALLLRGAWDDRRVEFWLAPEWHNIPVRITIVLGNELTLDIWANEIKMDGRTVLEWEPPVSQSPARRGGGR